MYPSTDLIPAADAPKLKTAFAEALLRNPDNAFQAGTQVFGAETNKALFAATQWVNDDFVLHEKARLLKTSGARAFLPSKEDYAREVWKTATDPKCPIEDKRGLLSLYGDVMGYKEAAAKPTGGITVNNNRVMIVKDHGTDSDWERRAMQQQHALTRGNADVIDAEVVTTH